MNILKSIPFNENIKNDFLEITNNEDLIKNKNIIKIDLHCHDHNSNEPDEILGRIINIPETWLKTEKLIQSLKKKDCHFITITNHNNTKSCYDLIEKGFDILIGCEFSCFVPDFKIGIHVLAYGFNKKEEERLHSLRSDIYKFQKYAFERNIPTIWAHPLYHHLNNDKISIEFYEKMSLIFERFEVINGQRDTWQNLLINKWINDLDKVKIDQYSDKFKINPNNFCHDPYSKRKYGGSDSHMGIFAGDTGTYLELDPDLEKISSKDVLNAIRYNKSFPYGSVNTDEKMWVAFLDYFCQISLNLKDPGLLRIFLHKGNFKLKMLGFSILNVFFEIQKHKITMKFLKIFHKCFLGKKPNLSNKLLLTKDYKKIFNEASKISHTIKKSNNIDVSELSESLFSINNHCLKILFQRVESKFNNIQSFNNLNFHDFNKILECFEMPSSLYSLLSSKKTKKKKKMLQFSLLEFLDGLSFPFLSSSVILGALFTSSKVLYQNRSFLNHFSKHLDYLNHPKKVLWLTDTFFDNNGVSTSLHSFYKEVANQNLNIDFCVCHESEKSRDHLHVIPPLKTFTFSFYKNQPLRIPDIMEIHKLFKNNSYDRIICSTEGIMGLISLYLKKAFSTPSFFFLHTDWLTFAKDKLQIDKENLSRFRRLLRGFYQQFDSIFVLNTDQKKWLMHSSMGFSENRVKLTKHWINKDFNRKKDDRENLFQLSKNNFIILYTGRISKEKGVFDIPQIKSLINNKTQNVTFVLAGTGPDYNQLKEMMPNALFLGWVDYNKLPYIYSSADILILPSKFDTFGCVLLESFSCGLPAISYNLKGPKDIIQNGKCGFLVNNLYEMTDRIIEYKKYDQNIKNKFINNALNRTKDFDSDNIINNFLKDIEI